MPDPDKEKLIKHLSNISPEQLLREFSSNNIVSKQELSMIKNIQNLGLSDPVINVLLHYVLFQNNFKLSEIVVKRFAKHWKRLEFTTARQAMDHAIKEQQQIKKRNKDRLSSNLESIKVLANNSNISDEQLGKIVRSIMLIRS